MATEIDENHLQVSEIAGELDCLFCLKAKDAEPQQLRRARSRRFSLWKRLVKKPITDIQPEIEHEASTPNKPMVIPFKKLKSTGVEIGRGAYGRVFEVEYEKIRCAAKEVHPLLLEAAAGQGKASLEHIKANFFHECQIWSLLQHPRIVEIIGIYYQAKDRFKMPVIVMEKMQFSLTGLVGMHTDFSFNQTTTILNDICLGLQYLHSRTPPIVHRDLTPNNILLCSHFRAKISDLGVARTLKATDAKTLTQAPGAPDFMPLECLNDRPVYGLPLDIFSFGGIILYITTKQWPRPAPWMNYDPDTGKKLALTSELQRRQQYLHKMTGTFVSFKPLVQSCLDDNPKNRPTIAVVLAKIKEVIIDNVCPIYCDILLVHKEGRETAETQKKLKHMPHHQQERQENDQQENYGKQHDKQEPKEEQHQNKHEKQEQHERQKQYEKQDLKQEQQKQQQQKQQKKQDHQNQHEKYKEQHGSQELGKDEQQQKQYEQQGHEKQEQQQSNLLENQKSYKQQQIQDKHGLQSVDRKQLKETSKAHLTRIAHLTESEDLSLGNCKLLQENVVNGDASLVPLRQSLPDRTYPLFMANSDFFSEKDEFLNFKKGDLLYIINREGDWWYGRAQQSDQEGYFPHNSVTDPDSLDAKVWFYGAITRKHAENILMQPFNYSGSFLIRNSESAPGDHVLSVKHINVMKHYKIRYSSKGYYVSCSTFFESIPKLVAHYSKKSDGLCINLKKPCLSTKPQSATSSEDATEIWEADRSSIQFTEKLATSQFGEVWQGIWNDTTEVAVKVLKKDIINTNEFLQEAVLIKQLRHPKIIKLYTVCTKKEPIYIITELMKHGSLLQYLKGDGRSLKLPQLIDMGAQVAAGMAYLEENMYVHRDLAARNILVTGNFICKVDVVSMARILSDNMYEAHTGAKCPIKWTSPEAALCNRFTIKSDVWSFGILLFELITYGRPPYPGLNNTEVLEALKEGFCMPCPKGCPEQLYDIMRDCWRNNTATRPTFESLHWRMENFYVENEPIRLRLNKVQ